MSKFRTLEKQFYSEISEILSKNSTAIQSYYPNTLRLSTSDEDKYNAFDMAFGSLIRVSVRIRKNKSIKYQQLTIRSRAKHGGVTEINKLVAGCSDIFFYCWLDEGENEIEKYMIIDIDKIRDHLMDGGKNISNGDGTEFRSYEFEWLMEHGAVIANNFYY